MVLWRTAKRGSGKGEMVDKIGRDSTARADKSTARLRIVVVAFVVAATLGSLAYFRGKSGPTPRTAPSVERLRYAMRDALEVTEPANVRTTENAMWLNQVCEGLVRFGADTVQVEPCLAERYEMSHDGSEWTFHLRRGVVFHDGTPLDASVVRFSIMRLLDPAHPYAVRGQTPVGRQLFGDERRATSAFVRDLRTPDEYTVVFVLSQPDVNFVHRLARVEASLVSPRAVRLAQGDGLTTIVGTGPMRIKRLQEGFSVLLERNPQYWGPPAKCREVEVRSIPDANERERALREGLCDLAQRFSPERLEDLAKLRNLCVVHGPSVHGCVLLLNSRLAPLDQPEVRQAISLALDRTQVVDRLLRGFGRPARGILPGGLVGAPAVEALSPSADVPRAKQLLETAGFKNGFTLKLTIPKEERPWNPAGTSLGDWLTENLTRIGLNVVVETAPTNEIQRRVASGDYQALVWGLTTPSGLAEEYLSQVFEFVGENEPGSASVAMSGEARTYIQQANRESDAAKRQRILEELQRRLLAELPWIPLFYSDTAVVARRGIAGVRTHPLGLVPLARIGWEASRR